MPKSTKSKKSKSFSKKSNFSPLHFASYMAAFVIVGSLTLWVAFAAPSGKGHGGGKPGSGSGSLSLVMVNDANSDGAPNWNDTITYNVISTATNPYVSTECFQNSTLVMSSSAGWFDSYPWPWAKQVTLKSDRWSSGAADCKAKLYTTSDGIKLNVMSTISFQAGP